MATDDEPGPDGGTQEPPGACTPCRGTGRLTSGLGGTPHEVRCPWCDGTGQRIPGRNAQEHPAEGGAAAGSEPATDPGTADATP